MSQFRTRIISCKVSCARMEERDWICRELLKVINQGEIIDAVTETSGVGSFPGPGDLPSVFSRLLARSGN